MPETIIAEGKYDEMVAVFMIYLRRETKKKMHTPQQQNTHRETERVSEWMRENRSKAFVMLMQSIFVLCMVIFVCTMHNARIKLNEFLPIFPSNIAFMVVNSVFFTNILFFPFCPQSLLNVVEHFVPVVFTVLMELFHILCRFASICFWEKFHWSKNKTEKKLAEQNAREKCIFWLYIRRSME